jgi:hypothetical protein
MQKNVSSMVVDGYGQNETDFLARLNQSPSKVQSDFKTLIIDPILAVLASSDQTAVLALEGHADRVDTPGLSREQTRTQELQASIDRANSASDGIFQTLASNSSEDFPSDWADLMQVGIVLSACGGAVLINSGVSLSEPERQQNRRVKLTLVSFLP